MKIKIYRIMKVKIAVLYHKGKELISKMIIQQKMKFILNLCINIPIMLNLRHNYKDIKEEIQIFLWKA